MVGRRSVHLIFLFFLVNVYKILPLVIFLCVGLGVYFYNGKSLPGFSNRQSIDLEVKVQLEKDYYVLVKLVELKASKGPDEKWDSDGSAPDIGVELSWQGADIFKSSVKENTFIAQWSTSEIDLRKVALMGEQTSVDDMIKGGRISIRAGEKIKVKIFDVDVLGVKEFAGTVDLLTSDLSLGEQTIRPKDGAVERLVLRVLDMNESPDILQ